VVSNAQPHEGAKVVIKIDLKDFFPTVHFYRVAGTFRYLGMGEAAANTLAAIVTHRNKLPDGTVIMPGALPQGAPTSPAITNIVCRRLDARLDALAKKADATYTRYADDLTFSFRAEPSKGVGRFLWWVDQVIQQEGFVQNAPKRRVLRPSNQQRITGVVVNNGLSVPRDARRRFRAILENVRRTSLEEQSRGKRDFKSYLTGFASYVKMVQPEVGNKLLAEVRSVLAEDARKKGTEK
jgi:retron-type reverse transcriptase